MNVESMSKALELGLVQLTPRERQVFDELHRTLGGWRDTRDVFGRIWGQYYAPNQLKVAIARMRPKLEGAGAGFRIETAIRAVRLVETGSQPSGALVTGREAA